MCVDTDERENADIHFTLETFWKRIGTVNEYHMLYFN